MHDQEVSNTELKQPSQEITFCWWWQLLLISWHAAWLLWFLIDDLCPPQIRKRQGPLPRSLRQCCISHIAVHLHTSDVLSSSKLDAPDVPGHYLHNPSAQPASLQQTIQPGACRRTLLLLMLSSLPHSISLISCLYLLGNHQNDTALHRVEICTAHKVCWRENKNLGSTIALHEPKQAAASSASIGAIISHNLEKKQRWNDAPKITSIMLRYVNISKPTQCIADCSSGDMEDDKKNVDTQGELW